MPSGVDGRSAYGVLADWNDDRGFGFIAPAAGGPRVFAHVSAFPRGRRPTQGCSVTYIEVRDERNRPRASAVRYQSDRPSGRSPSGVAVAIPIAALFFTLLVGLFALEEIPALLLAAYLVFSGGAFAMYGIDKSAAEHGDWRTPESTLHVLAMLGGWPGALIARQFFRHKTVKREFLVAFWVTVIVNCAALAWVVSEAPLTLP